MTKSNESVFDGLVPNNNARSVVHINSAAEIMIDDALMLGAVPFPRHSIKQAPENDNELTSPPMRPDPITGPLAKLLATIVEFQIARSPMVEVPLLEPYPAPTPAPYDEPVAVRFVSRIVR
jgi:hypothetical protein